MGANFGTVGMDWQQRVNWDRLRKYRTERVERLALRAQTEADVAALTGDVVDMESSWTV